MPTYSGDFWKKMGWTDDEAAQKARERQKRKYHRDKAIKEGKPVPQWAAARQFTADNPTSAQKRQRRYKARVSAEKKGEPIPGWAAIVQGPRPLTPAERQRNRRARLEADLREQTPPDWAAKRR